MKKAFLSLIAVGTVLTSIAQVTAGKVSYEEKITFKINLEGEAAQFAAMMPKEQKSVMVLHFTNEASIFMAPEKKEEEEINHVEGGAQVKIKMSRPDEKSFCDLKKNKKVEQKDFMSRKFIIESDISMANWKLTGQQKTILGYPCQEAVKEDSVSGKTIAWFTPAIPVSVGPSGFEGLPGLVLEVNAKNGEYTLNATAVEPDKQDVALLVKPTEGKKMSKEDFNKMMKEKTAEMDKEYGGHGSGGGNVIIKMRTN